MVELLAIIGLTFIGGFALLYAAVFIAFLTSRKSA